MNGESSRRCVFWNIVQRKSTQEGNCYFDSGFLGCMTADKSYLTNLKSCATQTENGRVIDKGTLQVKGLPQLENELLVDGLKVNLISISQLCDGDYHVKFT